MISTAYDSVTHTLSEPEKRRSSKSFANCLSFVSGQGVCGLQGPILRLNTGWSNQVRQRIPILSTSLSHSTQGPDTSLPPAELVRDAIRRSTIAHLFELYPLLCEIASSTRTAVAWMPLLDNGGAEEFDARTLASQCLEEIGKELN
jgi:hypothetical protein